MITVWKTPIAASVEQILRDLKLMLFAEGLLRDQNNTGSDVMVTCPFHKGGHERKPSCGVSLKEKITPDKTYEAGTVHCYTCGYTADLPTFISDLLGLGNAMEGFKWLVGHYNYSANDREEIQFNFFRGTDEGQVAAMDILGTYHPNKGIAGNCLSTEKRTNGAAAIFLPGVARRLSELLGSDLYLVFTSVHEVMVHNADVVYPEDLKEVLSDTLEKATPEEDYLTSSIYRYSRRSGEFSVELK